MIKHGELGKYKVNLVGDDIMNGIIDQRIA
jgi:hypothetical protein